MKWYSIYSVVVLLLAVAMVQSCSEDIAAIDNDVVAIDIDEAQGEIVDLLDLADPENNEKTSSSRTFRTLNQALRCTGLGSALFDGHKTIYAPSDAAFAKLGLNRHNVCTELDKETLTEILLYHVVGEVVSIRERGCIEPLNGDVAQVSVKRHRLFVNESRIRAAFNQRGRHYFLRVYRIDAVLMPPARTIVETASGVDMFSSLVAAVVAADPMIAETLSDPDGIFTVFAPTNDAFADLISGLGLNTLEDVVAAIGVDGLSTVLRYHVVPACAFSNDLKNGAKIPTAQGETITVDLRNLALIDKTDTPAQLVPEGLDIRTANGIVHTIDKVLLPNEILMML
ncbi:MAG: fasciclin domain-containing protein [Bacteroidota bacterium]